MDNNSNSTNNDNNNNNNILKQSFDTIMAPFTQSISKQQSSNQSHSFLYFISSNKNKNQKNQTTNSSTNKLNNKIESNKNGTSSKTGTKNSATNEFNYKLYKKSKNTANEKCIDNVHFNDLFQTTLGDSSAIAMPQSIRNDPRLFKDDVDIRFSRTLNSCKLPQIRYASPERIFERLTDLRFLSIDFLNTFLLTYRVFTDGITVLESLKRVHYNPEIIGLNESSSSSVDETKNGYDSNEIAQLEYEFARRISSTSILSEQTNPDRSTCLTLNPQQPNAQHRESVVSTTSDLNGTTFAAQQLLQQQHVLSRSNQHWRLSHRKAEVHAKERLRRVKEENKDLIAGNNKKVDQRTDSPDKELKNDKQPNAVKNLEKKQMNEEINVFKEPAEEKNKQTAKEVDKKTNTFLHLPLDTNLTLNNALSPDTNELILPPPSSPVNPAYSLKQRSRNKRHKIERRLNSFSGKNQRQNNSSEDSDEQINQGSSNDEEDENDDDVYVNSSVNQSSAEEELIDLESSEEKIGKLYTKSDLEKLFSKNVDEQENEDETKNKDKADENNLSSSSQPNQTSNKNNLLVVQHSHSSEKLKSLDSQSLPNSPTVLSSAASSATLVASPLSKIAPGSLEEKESFDKDNETNNQSKEKSLKDSNNNTTFKPQSTVSFSNQVDTKSIYDPSQSSQSSQQHYSSKSNTPKHTSQPQYFLWNQQHQNNNPFINSNIDYQPHHKLSTTSTTSGASMNYLRVKGSKNLVDNHNFLDSLNTTPRSSFQADFSAHTTPRSSFQLSDSQQMMSSKAGVVITSSRNSTRRSSSASASAAFAAATAASITPVELTGNMLNNLNINSSTCQNLYQNTLINASSNLTSRSSSRLPSIVSNDSKIQQAIQQGALNPNMLAQARMNLKRESVINTAATMRVLNVLRHWIAKNYQDFEKDERLFQMTSDFLEEIISNQNLLPSEHKVAGQLLQMLLNEDGQMTNVGPMFVKKIDLNAYLTPPSEPCKESLDTLTALEIAEAMTFIDHRIFNAIQSEEFLCQAWMKEDKAIKAPNILMMTKRFNEMSRLVASEIILANDINKRVSVIEKWTNVADICRCFHNYNGVLQVCSAFTNSSVFRLKKTWEKLTKSQKAIIEKLQIITSADGRFRLMRDAMTRTDPPCVPYLGMFLADLSFIEEGTPNFTEDGLLNFSKMRMIAHVILEVKAHQIMDCKQEPPRKVVDYLIDTSRHLSDDEQYQLSLFLEPRLSKFGGVSNRTSIISFPPGGTISPTHYRIEEKDGKNEKK